MIHKRKDSDLNEEPWIMPPPDFNETSAIVSPTSINHSTTLTRQSKKEPLLSKDYVGGVLSPSSSVQTVEGCQEAWFLHRGVRVVCKRSSTRISIRGTASFSLAMCCSGSGDSINVQIPYDEILSAWLVPQGECCSPCLDYSFKIYSLARDRRRPSSWSVREHALSTSALDQAKEWVVAINAAVAMNTDRPRSLMVFLNPVSGSWQARQFWEGKALPVFNKARVKCTVIETERCGHAIEMIAGMNNEELAQYQGLVAVGGDGLFQELVMGLMKQRGTTGSPLSQAALRMRVGHIPGGSTDAVAYTLHNTRSVEAAALHIALGDRCALDVARVDAKDGSHRHFVCQAAYGFLGDVMKFSEGLRVLGPSRYDLAGALMYLQLKTYKMYISYRLAADTWVDKEVVCTSHCQVCQEARNEAPLSCTPDGMPTTTSQNSQSRAAANAFLADGHDRQHGASSGLPPLSSSPLPPSAFAVAWAATTQPFSSQPHAGRRPPQQQQESSSTNRTGNQLESGGAPLHHMYQGDAPGSKSYANSGINKGFVAEGSAASTTSQAAGSSALLIKAGTAGSHEGPGACTASTATCSASGKLLSGSMSDNGREPLGSTISTKCSTTTSNGLQHEEGGMALDDACSSQRLPGDCISGNVGKLQGGDWTSVEGEFVSVMSVVTPCRSDKSVQGIIPSAHLADGRMYLVLVRKCNHLQYLRFLITLSSRGLYDLCLPYVRVLPVTAVNVKPIGEESHWNVDGELLSNNCVSILVQRGLVDVFARGVEVPAPVG
ncbi:hypothetical protein CEUSTIGMA_g11360.t1 [Chlamydomonas eustigma]|uniref:DAGKc domain-containing protein n=1 Tax=Chlamydomonas eustigma TaxID=1157962 RepID=A0A250XLM4_9CHLO|nr:hypothetical protein CEUSTIGMA_g11360.t1 [Chlamydomonas eustigma]|eukprot:GAX83936.1 hypothetical protein CEUSTIGMA_g11360.t1 [Chlamydomonas eustigma]